jgi:hypothetical protein
MMRLAQIERHDGRAALGDLILAAPAVPTRASGKQARGQHGPAECGREDSSTIDGSLQFDCSIRMHPS